VRLKDIDAGGVDPAQEANPERFEGKIPVEIRAARQ
jgi:hypothetical protein